MLRPLACGILAALLAACAEHDGHAVHGTEHQAEALIYGQDDRREVYEHPDARLRALAKDSAVAVVPREHLVRAGDGMFRVVGPTLAAKFDVCRDQRFSSQPAVAACSGVLIDDELVLTAGHCLTTDRDCASHAFVFDYFYRGAHGSAGERGAELEAEPIQTSDVYGCRRIVARRHTNNETTRIDFSVVQLDRPAAGRVPVRIRTTPLLEGERLTTVGCTSGLPVKIDSGARVLNPAPPDRGFFVLDSDTFSGSSGSGVFDREGALLGTIARGGDDYEPGPDGGCEVPARASVDWDAGLELRTGEEATYVAHAVEGLCSAGFPSPRLCATAPPCDRDACSAEGMAGACTDDCSCLMPDCPADAAVPMGGAVAGSTRSGPRSAGCSVSRSRPAGTDATAWFAGLIAGLWLRRTPVRIQGGRASIPSRCYPALWMKR